MSCLVIRKWNVTFFYHPQNDRNAIFDHLVNSLGWDPESAEEVVKWAQSAEPGAEFLVPDPHVAVYMDDN